VTTPNQQSNSDSSARLRLEFWPLERLVSSARNARTHGKVQVAEITGSIRAFGFTNPRAPGQTAYSTNWPIASQ
jgi:hypothetical protein